MRKLKIWFDVDGVLADFTTDFLGIVEEVTGRCHTPNDITDFHFDKCIVSEEENRACWDLINSRPGIVEFLQSNEEWLALAYTCRLHGHFVGALTSPVHSHYWIPERTRWLQRFGFTKREVIFASDKSHVAGDCLIDDRADNCVEWMAGNPTGIALLVDQPWNKAFIQHEGSPIRVQNSSFAADVLEMLASTLIAPPWMEQFEKELAATPGLFEAYDKALS